MIQHDRNFDDLAIRFARNIYGSAKGEVRLAIVWQHLLQTLPQLSSGKRLRILDAGCGLGQMGLRLAELGHELVLSDLSEKMVAESRALFAEKLPDVDVRFIHGSVQELNEKELGQFDLVLFHAVLEWLAEPKQTLEKLLGVIRQGGDLSLMFYNRDALVFRNLIRGNWRKAESDDLQGEEGGLTPYHPLCLEEVQGWLEACGFETLSRAGVRVIYDYMDRKMREERAVEEVVRIELKYAQHEPYLHMGRYLHLIAQKRES
ncbi:S-adenosylmethionine-dependent methyltransferase [Mariprofundus ferrinatatus]|uniref:S-adenosylmethionine-dependent methyltransferase n=1 Tax=Mariprofundus ferrinatatus TaxID=1921087 RepID=A0A2K8L656_9PROT|nr:methyltransferase domain-containing protein [Mariprofundus ferrinatatus]ATX82805.1 S-adenosylmethionine-dependent methyltransferase [Mariprofundus ferrinatatus]